MTETEKQHLRDLKASTAQWLAGNAAALCRQHNTDATDSRLTAYITAVAANPDAHNIYELLAVRRFLTLLAAYPFQPHNVHRRIRFYELLRFSGTNGRQQYKLTPVQVFQLAAIFGHTRQDGRRLTRLAYLFVPRKFSKTTFAAFLAVDDLLFGDNNAEAYIGANSYDQAQKCFQEVRSIMFSLDPRQKYFRINREAVRFRNNTRDSLIQCLTANATTKDGLFASLAILDEYAQARNTANRNGADLKNTLTTSMGPRREPLTVIITTASEVLDGPCYNEIEGCKAVLRGEKDNPSLFASLFLPDVDDDESDPKTWAKVQPHLGVTVQPDFYQAEWENAQLSAENMLAFRTKLLNIFAVSDTKTWFTPEKAQTLLGDFDIDNFQPDPIHPQMCAIAFDLSVRDDFSAVCYTIYEPRTRHFLSHIDYYLPDGTLPGHHNEQLYRQWAEAGHLRLCHGDRIDCRQIADDILRRVRHLRVIRIGYDAYKSQELVNILYTAGGRSVLQAFSQTYGSFNLPVEALEMLAYDTPPDITLNRNPINTFCLTNAVIDTDNLENKKPVKISHHRKIDGLIALLMTLGQLNSYEQ